MDAIALSGANIKGAYQAGIVSTLFGGGYQPGIITGISVGALNAGWAPGSTRGTSPTWSPG